MLFRRSLSLGTEEVGRTLKPNGLPSLFSLQGALAFKRFQHLRWRCDPVEPVPPRYRREVTRR